MLAVYRKPALHLATEAGKVVSVWYVLCYFGRNNYMLQIVRLLQSSKRRDPTKKRKSGFTNTIKMIELSLV